MKKLYEKSEITFAIVWIVIYTVGMGTLKSNFGMDSLWQMLGLIVLAVLIVLLIIALALRPRRRRRGGKRYRGRRR